MRRQLCIKCFLFLAQFLLARVLCAQQVQTIVPMQPIPVGAAFQVQYIVSGVEGLVALQPPAFGAGFRFVSGPRLYDGEAHLNNHFVHIRNYSYTLVPLRKGVLPVPGATAVFKNARLKSKSVTVQVADAAAATPPGSQTRLPALPQGAARKAALKRALFIKTNLSRTSCFAGEAIEATYLLYARLPAAAEIVKSPGFYGFSVVDVPEPASGGTQVQTAGGAFYNADILRHVQLYPVQAGTYHLDAMSVSTDITIADSATGSPVRATVLLQSDPLTILVKPLPTAAPENFGGAVGRFAIEAQLDETTMRQTRSGKLHIVLTGAGNFLQVAVPLISWPASFNVFEPTVTERLRHDAVPVSGSRTYSYTFTSDSAGQFTIPPVTFTYFDPAAKQYIRLATRALHTTIPAAARRHGVFKRLVDAAPAHSTSAWAGLAAVAVLIALLLFTWYGRRLKKKTVLPVKTVAPTAIEIIAQINAADADAYQQLQRALLNFFKTPYPQRATAQQVSHAGSRSEATLHEILAECEAVQYYHATPAKCFGALQAEALELVRNAAKRNER